MTASPRSEPPNLSERLHFISLKFLLEEICVRGKKQEEAKRQEHESYIRHEDSCPSFGLCPSVKLRGPPCILKRGGPESSGRILISSNGKTMRMGIFSSQKMPKFSVFFLNLQKNRKFRHFFAGKNSHSHSFAI